MPRRRDAARGLSTSGRLWSSLLALWRRWGAGPPHENSNRTKRVALVCAALLMAPLVYTVFDTNDGDIPLYYRAARRLLSGAMPYKSWEFEYPPYALAWVVGPALAGRYGVFRVLFSLELLALDLVTKIVVLREGVAREGGGRAWCGLSWRAVAPAVVLAVGTLLQAYFYLKRLDAIPASFTLLALVAFARGSAAWAGALLAIGTGTKLYPALLAPVLLAAALRRGDARSFVVGGLAGLAPLVLVAPWMPWWHFIAFHARRGLQVESTYASVIWLLHFFGLRADWVGRAVWMDVDGQVARAALPVARVVFGVATLTAVTFGVMAVRRDAPTIGRLARISLVPVLTFILFNTVFSTQYVIWLLPLAALAFLDGSAAPTVAIGIAAALSMFVFPAPGYTEAHGIYFGRTIVLVARNVALFVALAMLVREIALAKGHGGDR